MSETMVDVGAGALGGGAITGAVFWWIINGLKAEIHELRGKLEAVLAMTNDISTKTAVEKARVDRIETDVSDMRTVMKDGFAQQTRMLTQIAQSLKGLDE